MEGGKSLKVKTEEVRKHLLCKCDLFLLFFHPSHLTENTKCRFVQLFGLCVFTWTGRRDCHFLDAMAGSVPRWPRLSVGTVQAGVMEMCGAGSGATRFSLGSSAWQRRTFRRARASAACWRCKSKPWLGAVLSRVYSGKFFASLEIVLTLIKGVCLVCLPLSCLPIRAGRQIWSRDVCRPLVSRQSTVLESRWKDSAFLSASLQANSARMTNFSQCKLSLKVVFLLLPYLLVAPDFPKVRVPQRCLRSDALVGVVGEHLVEQRQRRGRAARDQPGDAGALFRREVEMHGSRPAGDRDETARSFACFAWPSTAHNLASVTGGRILKNPLLEFLEDALVRGPQHVVDLGHLVQLIGSGEERVQTERGGLEELTAATKLLTQLSV